MRQLGLDWEMLGLHESDLVMKLADHYPRLKSEWEYFNTATRLWQMLMLDSEQTRTQSGMMSEGIALTQIIYALMHPHCCNFEVRPHHDNCFQNIMFPKQIMYEFIMLNVRLKWSRHLCDRAARQHQQSLSELMNQSCLWNFGSQSRISCYQINVWRET